MKIAVKRDQFVGGFLVLIGVVYFLLSGSIDFPMAPDYPGPKAFPYIAIFGLIVCGLGIFIQSTLSKVPQKMFMAREGWVDMIKSFAALVIYVVGLKFLGYFISTPVLLFALSTIFGKSVKVKLVGRIVFSLVITAAVYIFYVYGFSMKLPVGAIFR
jgi:hypothetical protein